jgi:hypothetical protein
MEVLGLARVLWRRRIAVALGAIAAVALAFAIGNAPPSSYGVAWTRVALDTPESQLVETNPFGAETLVWRASLMVHLLAAEEPKRALARRVGIPPEQLAVVDPALSAPEATDALPSAAAELAAANPAPYVLTAYMTNDSLPLIMLEAAAPDRRLAARLVAAATEALKNEAQAGETTREVPAAERSRDAFKADTDRLQGFVVEDVAPVRTKAVVSGPGPMVAVAAAIVLFVLWSTCVAVLPRLVRVIRPGRLRTQDPKAATR